MVRLFAPNGATHFSHNGHEFEVGADGWVEVAPHVAVDLRSHGFKDAPPPPSETVSVKRSDLLAALEKLGTGANPDMDADKLAAALAAAVAAKEAKRATTLSIDKNKA